MQPDQQQNYWQPKDGEEKPTENYAPTDDSAPQTDAAAMPNDKKNDANEPVHWSAEEYLTQQRDGIWFASFAVVVLAFIALDIFLLKSYTFSALVIVMATSVVVFAKRPPKTVEYTLSSDQGLYVGEKLHHFSEFKAFGVISDSGRHSIMLIPTKRFAPGVTVYFPEELGEKIVDTLGGRLPMQELKLDTIDIIVRKLRL